MTGAEAARAHLAQLLEGIQRCVFFLDASDRSVPHPLQGAYLQAHQKDLPLFEAMAAVNERFAKLQDTLGAAMRHSLLLAGEQTDSFIKVLATFEKLGVLSSVDGWQSCRTARNLAAHDYETDYARIAEHFNTLHSLKADLYGTAARFLRWCESDLAITPGSDAFAAEFADITASHS